MKVKEITVTAVIPSAQYANIQPAITVEVDDDIEEAKALAMSHIVGISQQYAEEGKALQGSSVSGKTKKIECLVGGSINYDEVNHIYTNDKGEVYLSGSQYAKQFEKPFEINAIASKMATKAGVEASDIINIWKLKGNASASFGTAVHEALEMYGKYAETCKKLDKEYHMSTIPMIKKIVDDFFKGRESENALYEVMVVDHDRKWAGQIDRLVVTGDKKCIIEDYKTNAELKPTDIERYTHQLSFYQKIMESGGWIVEGIRLHHLDGSWKTIELKAKEIE